MKLILITVLSTLLSSRYHVPPPPPGPGFCGENAHYQCRQIGLAMSCGCVPND